MDQVSHGWIVPCRLDVRKYVAVPAELIIAEIRRVIERLWRIDNDGAPRVGSRLLVGSPTLSADARHVDLVLRIDIGPWDRGLANAIADETREYLEAVLEARFSVPVDLALIAQHDESMSDKRFRNATGADRRK